MLQDLDGNAERKNCREIGRVRVSEGPTIHFSGMVYSRKCNLEGGSDYTDDVEFVLVHGWRAHVVRFEVEVLRLCKSMSFSYSHGDELSFNIYGTLLLAIILLETY